MKCFMVEPVFGEQLVPDNTEWDARQVLEFVRPDTGERRKRVYEFGPGAMWHIVWYPRNAFWDNEAEAPLTVICPNGHEWIIDSRASNCTMKEDRQHRCWVRHGIPPMITVDKNGFTCSAGAGSIQAGDWHGFLRNGELVQ